MAEKVIVIADSVTVGDLAEKLNLPVVDLIGELFKNGIVATINQRIDFETASIIIEELGISDIKLEHKETISIASHLSHKLSKSAVSRPPIVDVMGHVDHGKTSILDAIFGTKKVDKEAGGITQHLSAYQVEKNGRFITFLDTPGHEAFAALRQHGAALTDVVVIVVAADDGVKPQTVEAIKFAKIANAKIIVAINKIDKPDADINFVKTQLANEQGLNPEEWGGDTVMVEVSAKTGQNIDKLLDMIVLVADMEELKADEDIPAEGLIIESHMEVGKGPVVSLLIQQGTIKSSQFIVAGSSFGKVKTLADFKGDKILKAGPATPVIVTGFKELPQFGDEFYIVKDEKLAKIQSHAKKIEREQNAASTNITASDMLKMMNQQIDTKELSIVVKADVQGSLTSVIDSIKQINSDGEIRLNIISSGVGNISENDIRLAADKTTIIYGFNVLMSNNIKHLANRYDTKVRLFNIIYDLLDDVRNEVEQMLKPTIIESEVGKLKVKAVFKSQKDNLVLGGEVIEGKVTSGLLVRVIRKNEKLTEASINNLQKNRQDVKEAGVGELCGLSLRTEQKIEAAEGDVLEFFTRDLEKRKLK